MTDPTTPAAVDPQQERGGDDAAKLRDLIMHTGFSDDADPDNLSVVMLRRVDRQRLRAVVAELERLRAERDWQPGRWRQVRRPDGTLWMETSDGDEAEAEARKQGWPLYRLWECRETEWRLMVDDTTPQEPEPTGGAR